MSRSHAPSSNGGRKLSTAMIALIAAGAVVVIAGVAGAVTLTGGSGKNAGLTSALTSHRWTVPGTTSSGMVAVGPTFTAVANVTPPVAATSCTTPSTFTYSGTLSATAPGTVKYQWVYSSGKPGPVQSVKFTAAGQRAVVGQTVTAKTAGSGWGEIKVLSPVTTTSGQAAYQLLCGGSTVGGVSATAAVSPAAKTATSCATTVPSFTAVGSIEAAKAETVTYYWAQSDGKNSAPATVTFTGPGTKTTAPLTIIPSAASGSGEAVLVVTSPVTTASAPATYTLTCKTPSASPTTSATRPAPGQAKPTSNPTSPAPNATSPASTPATPASNPTHATPVATSPAPTTAQPSSPANSGSGSMYIPEMDSLSDTIELGDTLSNGTQVDGGVAPYTWSITGLPPGVKQAVLGAGATDVSGIIGTPTATGTYQLTVTVTDSEQPPQTLVDHFTLVVLQPNSEVWGVITPGPLNGTVGVPFSNYFSATNGVTATFTVYSGELPPGISLNSTTGVIAGTPAEAGTFNFSVIATNQATGGIKDVGTFNFSIDPAS